MGDDSGHLLSEHAVVAAQVSRRKQLSIVHRERVIGWYLRLVGWYWQQELFVTI